MTKIKKLLASSTEISAALDAARTTATDADAAVSTADKAYRAALLTETPAALRALLDEQVDQKIVADQARARATKLEADLEKARAAEAEDGRVERYANAKALADTAREKLWQEYPAAAASIREILRAIAEADIAVASVNEDLPAGAARLDKPEDARNTPNEHLEEVGRDKVLLWAPWGALGTPVSEGDQKQVQNQGRKSKEGFAIGYLRNGSSSVECELRPFDRVKFLPGRSGWTVNSLAGSIALPGLEAGDSDFWEPTSGGATYVLRELDKPALKRPPYQEREPKFSYSRISG